MTSQEMAEALREIMEEFDQTRAAWVAAFGTAAGHGAWFTGQLARLTKRAS